MTTPTQGTPRTDDLPGPNAASARRARLLGAGVAATAVLLLAGGMTATYAASVGHDPVGTGFGTLVDPTTGAGVDGPIEIIGTDPVTIPSAGRDCPEKPGGPTGGTGQGSGPATDPATPTSPAPETSTL
jgi:hypothetical protein